MKSGNNKQIQQNRSQNKTKRRLLTLVITVALALVGLAFWLSFRPEQLYKVTVLPTLGGSITRPSAIYDCGQIVGISEISINKYHLFLWDCDNGIKDLGPGFSIDINNVGQIAGTMIDPKGSKQAFLWDPNNGRQMLNTNGRGESYALALNNRGQVVGFLGPGAGRTDACIWDGSEGVRKLVTKVQEPSIADAINDSGQIIGYTHGRAPCFWASPGAVAGPALSSQPRDRTDFPGWRDLNNSGYVLCRIQKPGKDRMWACLWRKQSDVESIRYLFPLENTVDPMQLNDANQVLYSQRHRSLFEGLSMKYFGPHTKHYLWDPKRGRINLNRQIPHEIGELMHIEDINNKGCIIATVRSRSLRRQVAVLLEPLPERQGK